MSELDALRGEISELDQRLLELLNRRLELVAAVRDYKDSAGERWIDPAREAELLQTLVAANPGPLTERGVGAIFSAILDVLKQEVAAGRQVPVAYGRSPVGRARRRDDGPQRLLLASRAPARIPPGRNHATFLQAATSS